MLTALLGKSRHRAQGTKRWCGTFEQFVAAMLKDVPVTTDKSAAGWICGASFTDNYRDGDNLIARYFLSLDFDHIAPSDVERILEVHRWQHAFLAYTTWSHEPEHPRIRVWVPLSRPVSAMEYEAISRHVVARVDIELADPKSWDSTQFMYRPARQEGIAFQYWTDTDAPYLDVDSVLAEYADWTDEKQWPCKAVGDRPSSGKKRASPLTKSGIVGAFCRAYPITRAIEEFGLPYHEEADGRWTHIGGDGVGGAIIYDHDTALHSHHHTDPAHGQSNSFDLVRIHRYRHLDLPEDLKLHVTQRPSHKAMIRAALEALPPEWESLDA